MIFFLGTKQGELVIIGVQGRYFIPYILPLVLCLNTDRLIVLYDSKKLIVPMCIFQLLLLNIITSQIYVSL